MKLLCIERDRKGLLQVGGIYTPVDERACPGCKVEVWQIEEHPTSSGLAGRILPWTCLRCGTSGYARVPKFSAFLKRRFVPWNPDELKVTEQQVKELFQPQPTPEECEAILRAFRPYTGFDILSIPYDTGS